MSGPKTVGDEFRAAGAGSELKRRGELDDLEEVSLLGVQYQEKGQVQLEDPLDEPPMRISLKLLADSIAKREKFQRFILKPQVISLAAAFTERVLSGKTRAGASICNGMKVFLAKEPENRQLVSKLIQEAKLGYTPEDFADLADGSNKLQNDDEHNSLDEALIKQAKKLKEVGAVRLLCDEFSWECSIIENMEELVKRLNEVS